VRADGIARFLGCCCCR